MKSLPKKTVQLVLAVALIIALFIFLLAAAMPYFQAFIWALILFTIFMPLQKLLEKKTGMPRLSALLVILVAIMLVITPFLGILNLSYNELVRFKNDQESTALLISELESFTGQDIDSLVLTAKRTMRTFIEEKVLVFKNVTDALGILGKVSVSLIIAFFTLFFLLIERKKAKAVLMEIAPFNRKNSELLVNEMNNVTKSTVIGVGLVALIQGALVSIGFLIFGIQGAVLWGVIAAVLSFIPVIGPPMIWVPAGLFQLLLGDYVAGIGILLWGAILVTNIDNFLRPYFSRKFGNIHPLTTLIGVFIGVPIFNLAGLIIGPLLIQYIFLTAKMFDQEYIRG